MYGTQPAGCTYVCNTTVCMARSPLNTLRREGFGAMPTLYCLLLLCLLCTIPYVSSFQSDEVQGGEEVAAAAEEEEEEDNFLTLKNKNIITEQVLTTRARSFSSTGLPPTDSKIQFEIQHSFGDSDFSPAGSFSARLRNSHLHSGQVLTIISG